MRMTSLIPCLFALATCWGGSGRADSPPSPRPFVIRVVDEETGRGVPLVELRTTTETSFWTDSAGVVSFSEPGLLGRQVFFEVRSHGYEFPADGFGFRGKMLATRPGASAELKVKRINIAERLYRVTGQGIYRDSVMAGLSVPIQEPLLNGLVVGQDTVVAIPYQGRIHWFWGDTERPAHPLGHFGASGAVSELPRHGGLDPAVGINLRYYTNAEGFSRPMCVDPERGMKWLEGLMLVRDPSGRERLVARYAVMRDLGYAHEWVLGVFDPDQGAFQAVARYDVHTPHMSAHPFQVQSQGVDYWHVFPTLRVRANWHSVTNPAAYESFTAITNPAAGGNDCPVDWRPDGTARHAWRAGLAPFSPDPQQPWVTKGKLPPSDHWHFLHDIETGLPFRGSPLHGSVNWSGYRRCWISVFSGEPGDIWYAEADTPVGPWVYARKVLSHDRYNFYNPTHHAFFDQDFGREIYFEGTYTAAFSSAPAPTPRYDYNQIIYRLRLDDPRLHLPAPVYRLRDPNGSGRLAMAEAIEASGLWADVDACAFFAWPAGRRRAGLVPIYAVTTPRDFRLARQPAEGEEPWATPLFYALDVTEAPDQRPLDGFWRCLGNMPSGSQHDFGWEFHAQGGLVTGRFDPDSVFRVATVEGGTLQGNHLEIRVSHAGTRYLATGKLEANRLDGTWKRLDEEEAGTWSGQNVDPHPRPRLTPAVVPLFEFVHEQSKQRFYTTESSWEGPGFRRTPSALCRVLRNPQRSLVIDPNAKPPPAPGS